jgi:hypothetical protein
MLDNRHAVGNCRPEFVAKVEGFPQASVIPRGAAISALPHARAKMPPRIWMPNVPMILRLRPPPNVKAVEPPVSL